MGGDGGYDPRQKSGIVTAIELVLPHQWSKKNPPSGVFLRPRAPEGVGLRGGDNPRVKYGVFTVRHEE